MKRGWMDGENRMYGQEMVGWIDELMERTGWMARSE